MYRTILAFFLSLIGIVCPHSIAIGEKMSHRTPNVSDFIRMRSFPFYTSLQLSPDGEYLAYTVINPQRQSVVPEEITELSYFLPTGALKEYRNSEVWVTNISTGKSNKLGSDTGIDWAPQWSPDGRYVAFYSDRMGAPQLWVWDSRENKQRRISDKPVSAIYGFEVPLWTSNGKHLITKLRPEGEDFFIINSPDTDEQGIKVWETITDEQTDPDRRAEPPAHIHGDLAIFDFESGEVSILAEGLYTLGMLLSPDDTAVVVLNFIGSEKLTSQAMLFDLLLVPLDGTSIRHLATNITLEARGISWAPNGKYLAYTHPDGLFLTSTQADEQRNLTADLAEKPQFFTHPLWNPSGTSIFCGFDGHVWELPIDGSGGRKLTEGLNPNIVGIVAEKNTRVIWQSRDAQFICVQTHDPETKHTGFYQVGIDEARTTPLLEAPIFLSYPQEFELKAIGHDTQIVYRAQSATYPEEVWILDVVSGRQHQVINLNPQLSDIRFGETRLIDVQTPEGQHLRGALMLPSDYEEGRRYPLVTWIYPSHHLSNSVYKFGFGLTSVINYQLLANRGYAVLGVDIPLESNEPLKEIIGFVLPTVDQVIEMGIADASRLGIIGYSYGGYGTVGVIAHTTRFKAAVVGGGVYNMTSYYGRLSEKGHSHGIGWAEGGQGSMPGSLWEERQRYIDNSPIFHLDKVETPLLIYCGTGEYDFAQSGELFSGLRRLKKTGTLVWYRGGAHQTDTWPLEHRVDSWERIIAWFEKHLE